MSGPQTSGSELSTWQEIAEYLGVSVRTAQNFEQENRLPVHRLPGKKGRVYAYEHEVDGWKEQMAVEARGLGPDEAPLAVNEGRVGLALRRFAIPVAVALGIASAGFGLYWLFAPSGHPTGARFEGNELVVTNQKGRELWRYTFPNLLQPGFYADLGNAQRGLWFGDLDGDGEQETLFNYRASRSREEGTSVYCFSQSGKVLWQFSTERAVADQEHPFSSVYYVNTLLVLPGKPRGEHRILVSSVHAWGYPAQLALLNSKGQLLSEYWHSGHLWRLAAADLDGDGKDEVLAAGFNIGYRQATLVVLDPGHLGGASVQGPGDPTQLKGFSKGTEKVIVRFPRVCFSEKFEAYSYAYQVAVTPTSIEVSVSQSADELRGPYVLYQLSRDFKLISVELSPHLIGQHRELEAAGRLDHAWSQGELEKLKEITVIRQ